MATRGKFVVGEETSLDEGNAEHFGVVAAYLMDDDWTSVRLSDAGNFNGGLHASEERVHSGVDPRRVNAWQVLDPPKQLLEKSSTVRGIGVTLS